MLKFKYHYLTNTLLIQKPLEDNWYQIPPEQQFQGNFEAQGFTLEPENHWISFQIKENSIQAFYKLPEEPHEALNTTDGFWTPEKITYYRQYLPKQEEVIFTFSEKDEVEKVAGKWIKKGANR